MTGEHVLFDYPVSATEVIRKRQENKNISDRLNFLSFHAEVIIIIIIIIIIVVVVVVVVIVVFQGLGLLDCSGSELF
jgi:flagellar basal body-associated protein FliL